MADDQIQEKTERLRKKIGKKLRCQTSKRKKAQGQKERKDQRIRKAC